MAKKLTKPRAAKPWKVTPVTWGFLVRSYKVVAEFSKGLPDYQPSLTTIGLSSETGGPTASNPNAVAYFYWPGKALPKKPTGVHNNTLELHYSLSALGGILQLLNAPAEVYCFHRKGDPLGPRAGLEHPSFVNR